MAENLWVLREQKQMSVANLANRSGLPIRLIMEYEAGQQSIDPKHLARLARVMYIEESDIKLQSDPRPGSAPLERRPARRPKTGDSPPRAEPAEARPRRGEREPPLPPGPARPSQISHLENLLGRLGKTRQEVEDELEKPLTECNRVEMSELLKKMQAQVQALEPVNRRRAYLPESVDEHEAAYLAKVKESTEVLHFTLFDGASLCGQVIGFGPYNITLRQADGTEVSVNKLAIVTYRKGPAPVGRE